MKSTQRNTSHFFSAIFIALTFIAGASIPDQAESHPHDLLAQCQLPSGKWVMCDQTKHDLTSNQHVEKSKATMPNSLKSKANGPTRAVGGAQMPAATGSYAVPFSVNCADGFSKAGEKKMPNGDMDWFVCTTPVIKCPGYVQSNGKKAYVTATAIVQLIGANPDGGEQKFRVQYKCDYGFNAIPEG